MVFPPACPVTSGAGESGEESVESGEFCMSGSVESGEFCMSGSGEFCNVWSMYGSWVFESKYGS